MAELERDRGQILLIAAFSLALILISLAIITNAVIYTQSLASRDSTSGSEQAIQMRGEVESTLGSVVRDIDDKNLAYVDGESRFTGSLSTLELVFENELAVSESAIFSMSVDEHIEGREIREKDDDPFTDPFGSPDWEVVSGVDGTRNFTFEIEESSIDEDIGSGNEFIIELDSGDRKIKIGDSPSSGTNAVRVIDEGGTDQGTCEVSGSDPWTVDVTAMTVGGEPCEPLAHAWDDIGNDYDIAYENGDAVSGSYWLIVEGSSLSTATNDACPDDPCEQEVYYGAEVEVEYRSPSMFYKTIVRIAPGEPHE